MYGHAFSANSMSTPRSNSPVSNLASLPPSWGALYDLGEDHVFNSRPPIEFIHDSTCGSPSIIPTRVDSFVSSSLMISCASTLSVKEIIKNSILAWSVYEHLIPIIDLCHQICIVDYHLKHLFGIVRKSTRSDILLFGIQNAMLRDLTVG
jgi:hypothetical protein